MNIILKHIPANTVNSHVTFFLNPVLAGGVFKKKGTIEQISIFKNTLAAPNVFKYYAVVNIEPDSVARRVIDKLNHKKLNGKLVEVCEFHDRHWSHERRKCGEQIDVSLNGRRKGERRHKQERVEVNKQGIIIDVGMKKWK